MEDNSAFFNQFIIKMNDSILAALKDMGLVQESKQLFDFLSSDEWINIIEMGTNQQVIDNFGAAIDPLTNKLMGVYGPDLMVSLPVEMIQWIKDTSILFIKNKGGGNATTEESVITQNQVQYLN